LNVAPKTVLNALSGTLTINRTQTRSAPDVLAFQGDHIHWPDPRKARWLYAEIATGLRQPLDATHAEAAAAVFRPDLFDAATGNNAPPDGRDPIGLHFGPAFDASDLAGYIAALARGAAG
jgi:NitT/TauT family transport system ATP-binding protein